MGGSARSSELIPVTADATRPAQADDPAVCGSKPPNAEPTLEKRIPNEQCSPPGQRPGAATGGDGSKPRAATLGSVFEAGLLISAWFFVTGWIYLYYYYRSFGVNINSLNFPIYHFPVYTLGLFVSGWLPGVAFFVMCPLMVAIVFWGAQIQRKLLAVVFVVLFLALFLATFFLASYQANELARRDMREGSRLPLVVLQPKRGFAVGHSVVDEALRSSDLRLLIEQEDRLLVFVPLSSESRNAAVQVLQVSRDDIWYSIRAVVPQTE